MNTPRPNDPAPIVTPVEDTALVRARARGRTRLVGTLLGLALLAISAQGAVNVVDPDPRTLSVLAEKRWRAVPVEGQRGTVYTADGTELATSVRHPSIYVDPVAVREQAGEKNGLPVAEVARRIAGVLGRPESEIRDILDRPGRFERVAVDVHPEVADRMLDLDLARRGVIVQQGWRRFYPQGGFASQLVGFVDGEGIGRQGIEHRFHTDLVGAEVVAQRRVNRWGGVLDLLGPEDQPVAGRHVHTTIDRVVQQATEAALEDILEAHAPLSAIAVVIEVDTGRIVAMASAPSFDPNRVDELTPEQFSLTQNLSVTALFEPGSVLKPFTMAAGLEAGVIQHDTILETGAVYAVGDKNIRDDHPHGQVTVDEMVKYSSNIAAAKIGRLAGDEALMSTFERLGFGVRTGIDTQGELAGRRRPGGRFGPVELANVSFGQGIQATALQLAVATATIANGGLRMRPILVDRVVDPQGRLVQAWEPERVGQAVSPEVARQVTRAMEMVLEPGGTATRAVVPGYKGAGKTGTAQKAKGGVYTAARVSTFIGFAPSDRPKLAMAVIVDEPSVGSRYGGIVAAPAFASVMSVALPHLGVQPDPGLLASAARAPAVADPALPVGVEPLRVDWDAAERAWRMPDLAGRSLRDALAALQATGVGIELEGSGALVSQMPTAGSRLLPGDTVRLVFH